MPCYHRLLLILLGGVFFGVGSAQAKPNPPVLLTLQSEVRELSSEDEFTLTIQLQGGSRAVFGGLSLEIPPGVLALSSLPEFQGELNAKESRTFFLVVRILDPKHAPLTATFVSRGDQHFKVQGHWQPRERGILESASRKNFSSRPGLSSVVSLQAVADSVTLTGTFVYRNRAQDGDGFVHENLNDDPISPVRQVRVEILKNGEVVGSGETTNSGAFSFRLPESAGTYTARIKSELSSHRTAVRSYVENTLFLAQSTGVELQPGEDIDFGELRLEAGDGGEAFNVLDAILDGVLLLEDITGELQKNSITVFWGHPTSSFYIHGSFSLTLATDDGYDDSVILHEYGHYVTKDYSQDQSPGGDHFVDDDHQDPLLSWGEGLASFWQAAVRLQSGDSIPSWYVDTEGLPGRGNLRFSYDCEGPSFPVLGVASEVVVQSSLWDIIDGPGALDLMPGVDDDNLELPLSEVWEVLTDFIPGRPSITLEDFWQGWFSGSIDNGHPAEMEAVFTALGVELFDDFLEPDDSVGQAKGLVLGAPSVHHTFYEAQDVDYHQLALDADQVVIVETSNLIGWSDTKIEILDPALTSIAESDDRIPGVDISSQVSFVAELDGDYTVIISKVNKGNSSKVEFGSYDVRAIEAMIHGYPFASFAQSAGIDNTGFGVGPSFGDYNGDGFLDLVVVNNPADADTNPSSEKDVLYRNQGNGAFANTTQTAGLGHPEGGVASAWGDMDNDGDLDLFLSNHALYRNDGGSFVDISEASGVVDLGAEFDGKWADADNDGFLDLFVAVRDRPSALWHNNGDGTFVEIAADAGLDFPENGGEAYTCAWGDYDRDGRRDLFVGFNTMGDGHKLFRNVGHNNFLDVTQVSGLHTEDAAAGAVWGDVNGDGWVDLYVCSPDVNKLYINLGDGTFAEKAQEYGIDVTDYTRGAGFADYDLDGDLDLYLANFGTPSSLYENVGGSLIKINEASGNSNSFGMAWGDYDGDGDPDIYVAQARDRNLLWRNGAQQAGAGLTWLKVKLEGVLSNSHGLGATITLYGGENIQVREVGTGFGWASMSVQPELFGIPGGVVDSVRVDWPSGAWNVELLPQTDRTLIILEDDSTPVREDPFPGVLLRMGFPRPNPFAGATSVTFSLGRETRVVGYVYDISGRKVARVVDALYPAGDHRVGWDGRTTQGVKAAPGVYFYRLTAGGVTQSRKVIRLP